MSLPVLSTIIKFNSLLTKNKQKPKDSKNNVNSQQQTVSLLSNVLEMIHDEVKQNNQRLKYDLFQPIFNSLYDLLFPYIALISGILFIILILNIIILFGLFSKKIRTNRFNEIESFDGKSL
jgi:hypothetical protein